MTFIVERKHTVVEFQEKLFAVQCRVLDLGTNKSLSAKRLREELMNLRQEIIDFRERVISP